MCEAMATSMDLQESSAEFEHIAYTSSEDGARAVADIAHRCCRLETHRCVGSEQLLRYRHEEVRALQGCHCSARFGSGVGRHGRTWF